MDALEMLLGRSSALKLGDPAPSDDQLARMFEAAVRAPDHGRLRPWHFLVIPRDKRERFGELLARSMQRRMPDASAEMLQRERDKALRAPVIVVATARLRRGHKIPEIEQRASAAAAVQNVMLAAHAQGYGAMWKTGDPAYDPGMTRDLGLTEDDEIVGFLYVGTREGGDSPAARPVAQEYVAAWPG